MAFGVETRRNMLIPTLAFALAAQRPEIDFAKAWTGIRSAIEQRYYARKERGGQMKALLDKYEPKAKAATTEEEFGRDVNDMIAEFGDSHFGFFTKSDQGYYMMDGLVRRENGAKMPNVGAWFRPAAQGWEIQMLVDGGPAAEAGLRKGDIVTSVDGSAFTPVVSLVGKVDNKVRLEYMRSGSKQIAEVEVTESNGVKFFADGTNASQKVIERDGKKYAYIHLWTMSNETEKNALANAVYGRFRDTDGFILDIRDGFGGRPEGFGDPFFRPQVNLAWEFPTFTQTQLFGYQRPLVVLINKGSRSAKEVFAYIMKESKRATLVGEQTGGNVLGTSPSPVGDWGYLEIPMVDVKTNGVRLEKVGVSPDVRVPAEFDSSGSDLYIEEAIKVLGKQVAAKRAA
jgi:carboxyl-terminal processing protease